MKFFTRKIPEKKVNPTSKKLVESTIKKLEECGIAEPHRRVNCTNKLMRTFADFIRALQKGGVDVESVSVKYTDDMKATMTEYGITDVLKQEDVILNFIAVLYEYMENPNGT